MARNIGKPKSLLVTIVSKICVEVISELFSLTIVSARAPAMKPYFSLAIAEVISSSGCSWLKRASCWSRRANISLEAGSSRMRFSTSASFSSSFMARYRGEKCFPIYGSVFNWSLSSLSAFSMSLPRLMWM